jgi:hypothetical protein
MKSKAFENWRAIQAKFEAGATFDTIKEIRSLAPIDNNFGRMLIELGYITPSPPYQLANKNWNYHAIWHALRAYYKQHKPRQYKRNAKPAPPELPLPAAPRITTSEYIHEVPDAALCAELERRGWYGVIQKEETLQGINYRQSMAIGKKKD